MQYSIIPLGMCTVWDVLVNITSPLKFSEAKKLSSYLKIPHKMYVVIMSKLLLDLDIDTIELASFSIKKFLVIEGGGYVGGGSGSVGSNTKSNVGLEDDKRVLWAGMDVEAKDWSRGCESTSLPSSWIPNTKNDRAKTATRVDNSAILDHLCNQSLEFKLKITLSLVQLDAMKVFMN